MPQTVIKVELGPLKCRSTANFSCLCPVVDFEGIYCSAFSLVSAWLWLGEGRYGVTVPCSLLGTCRVKGAERINAGE
ncbi:MAG: hypothetical protein ACTSUS_10010 [Candidatus Freyarchaeota archaeon]